MKNVNYGLVGILFLSSFAAAQAEQKTVTVFEADLSGISG